MLELRLITGFPVADITPAARPALAHALSTGLLAPEPFRNGQAILTLQGRLLADALIRDLT